MTPQPRIAFYAPMKSPGSEKPSGDREIARRFVQALEQGGASVEIASHLRARDGTGSNQAQQQIRQQALAEAEKLIARYRNGPSPTHWFTYHLFHKAPDWIGPRVAQALSIPYIVAEASFAPKQAGGRWDEGHRQVENALRLADAVVVLNPVDLECVKPLLSPRCTIINLPIWIDVNVPKPARNMSRQNLAERFGIATDRLWLATVAMMRPGDKTDSFKMLASSLKDVDALPWHLLIAGDGASSQEIKRAFSDFADRTVFLGSCDADQISAMLSACDLMVWPAINEAIGMALLEGQSHGLPVVAGDSGGVHTVVESGTTGLLTRPHDTDAFAQSITRLLNDHALRSRFSTAATENVNRRHSIASAAAILQKLLKDCSQ